MQEEKKIMNGKYTVDDTIVKDYQGSPKYLIKAIVIAPLRCIPPKYQVMEYIANNWEEAELWMEKTANAIVDCTIYPILNESGIRYTEEIIQELKKKSIERKEKEQLQKLKDKYPEDGKDK